MAVEHMENWAIYGGVVANLLNGVYAEASGPFLSLATDPDGFNPTKVLSLASVSSNQAVLRYVLAAPQTTVGVAHRMWFSFLPTINAQTCTFFHHRDVNNVTLCYGKVNTTGGFDIYNGSNVRIGGSSGPVITANAWFHIESRVVIAGASSTVTVRVEGVPVVTLTGLSLGVLPIAQTAFLHNTDTSTTSNPVVYYKDFVTWNDLGSFNNTFLGPVVVYTMAPDSDVTLGGWTSTAANGFSVLDNVPPVDASAYITATTPPVTASQYGLQNLPANVTAVKALMTMVRAKKIDGGDGNLQTSLVSGVSTANGADRPITAAFTYWRDVFETDPATSLAWSLAGANGAQMKINRTV